MGENINSLSYGYSIKEVNAIIREHIPYGVKKIKKLFLLKYYKLTLLFLSIILAYYFFSFLGVSEKIVQLGRLNYLGTFIAGMFFAFGFTAPFSVGFFLTISSGNIFLLALIAGLGAMVSDLLIFKFIKFSFLDEFQKLKKEKVVVKIKKFSQNHTSLLLRNYLLYIFAGILISSPLPDEIGVSMLAGFSTISMKKLAIIGFILNSFGIFLILYLGFIF